jgi:nucleoside-diphosphate-sugar epimerase
MPKTITITGGSGFVGRLLQSGLRDQGYQILIFDRMRGYLVDFMRRRYFGTCHGPLHRILATYLRRGLRRTEQAFAQVGVIGSSGDDILDVRSRLADRFRKSDIVIHLAALPHPHVAGATDSDFRRINYEGSINVFEAARDAGVAKFIYASSAQVYGINNPVRIDQFPIVESNYCPTVSDGQNMYGFLKREFEHYLEQECSGQGKIQAVSLRLEFPGVRSTYPWNFYISTSIENTIAGFVSAIETDLSSGYDVFNLADRYVDDGVVNIQQFLKQKWAGIPNYTIGNECLLGTEKASSQLNYKPTPGGTYFLNSVMW